MREQLAVETRLLLSKFFAPGIDGFRCGRYTVRAIPSTVPGNSEALLQFADDFEGPGGGSHPEEEASIFCDLLSVALGARVKRQGLRINAIEMMHLQSPSPAGASEGALEIENVESDLGKVLTCDVDLGRQLGRACRAYASALEFIPSDPTFAFFLLVVAVECLSSQAAVIPGDELPVDPKKCDRFCTFIERFLPNEIKGDDERNATLLRELLKEAYFAHRSGFVHGGREVSSAALMADRVGSSYFKHATGGKEVKTPGLRWFAQVVRGALLGYVRSLSAAAPRDSYLLSKLAHEKALLRIKAGKAVEAGHIVTFGDIEYR